MKQACQTDKPDDSKLKTRAIHRLVAIAFIENSEEKAIVNHLNGNKLDNKVKNLEWATQKENIHHREIL